MAYGIESGYLISDKELAEYYNVLSDMQFAANQAELSAETSLQTTKTIGTYNFIFTTVKTNNQIKTTVTVGGVSVIAHPNGFVIQHHLALDELIPKNIFTKMYSTGGTNNNEIISELKKDNLANKVLDVYYRIKRNVEYIAQGKESLYSINPHYPTILKKNNLNSRHSRHYFYLIAHDPTHSFGLVVNLAAHLLQNNKLRLEQNTRGLQGYKLL